MFDVGFWELTFLMTLALLVLGPDRLPGLVTGVGRWLGRARAMARSLRLQIERELADRPVAPTTRSEPTTPGEPAAGSGDAGADNTRNSESVDEPGTRF